MPTEDLPGNPSDWSEPERQLHSDALSGRATVLGSGDPSGGESWGPDRTIRADAVRRLLTDQVFASGIVRLRLKGAKIDGKLDFEAATLNGTLELSGCYISEVVNLEQATVPAVYLDDCNLAGILAGQLHTAHNFSLAGATCAFVVLTDARIDGQLELQNAVLPGSVQWRVTLGLRGISVRTHAYLNGITVKGPAALVGAHIGGQLSLRKATLTCRGAKALEAHELETSEDALFDEGFSAEGGVDLTGSVIGGSLYFNRAAIHHPGKDRALDLARVRVKQNMYCGNGCTIQGLVLLDGAEITGSLVASGGEFLHPSDTAINATRIQVGGDVVLGMEPSDNDADRNGFRAVGKVILAGAMINGTLNCEGDPSPTSTP